MKSFKFLFIVYLVVINIVGLLYIYATSIETMDAVLLLEDRLKYLFFTSLGGGLGVLSYFYFLRPVHFTFAFRILLWCVIFYQIFLAVWARGLFKRAKKEK